MQPCLGRVLPAAVEAGGKGNGRRTPWAEKAAASARID